MTENIDAVHIEPMHVRSYRPGNVGTVASSCDYRVPLRKYHRVGRRYTDVSRVYCDDSKLWATATIQNPTPFGYLFQIASNGAADPTDYSQVPRQGAVPQIYNGDPENLFLPDNPSEPGTLQSLQDLIGYYKFNRIQSNPDPLAQGERMMAAMQHPVYKKMASTRMPRRDVLHAMMGQGMNQFKPIKQTDTQFMQNAAEMMQSPDPHNEVSMTRPYSATEYLVGNDARYRNIGGGASGAVRGINGDGSSAVIGKPNMGFSDIQLHTTQEQLPVPPNAGAILNQEAISYYDGNAQSGSPFGVYPRATAFAKDPPEQGPPGVEISAYNESISGWNVHVPAWPQQNVPPIAQVYKYPGVTYAAAQD